MQLTFFLKAFLALAQETRLAAYRLLVKAGPLGLAAGEIAEALGVNPSTLSRHLAQLERAKLLRSWRVQRQVRYAIDWQGTNQLLRFLLEDCCQADPAIWPAEPPPADDPLATEP
ncbi:winged helix-turn-helix domain-containing protein [Nodosilinea sp. E11]|uniref:ArsR/SmtB family transcription factor n=1 Tax=Nodosilinea sp. E11 TaxID=3037479 RepID=UPI002934DA12|nr:winged helix-turn-helix domain-containing protein [Nodosilinea sp. E11]WOD38076.1 winged helix-turn-helix domain-containing protein [Nodosilinea sp. E11]